VKKLQAQHAQLEADAAGRIRVSGVLDATTVGALLTQSRRSFAGGNALNVDLSGVTEADSAGLALLIEWVRAARQSNRTIRFENVPAQITALARISEVEELLFGTAKA
jgi:phospholipid transport system transporter-binding protein